MAQQAANKQGRPAKSTQQSQQTGKKTVPAKDYYFNNPDCPSDYNEQNDWVFEKIGNPGGNQYVVRNNGVHGARWKEGKWTNAPIRLCTNQETIYLSEQADQGVAVDQVMFEEGLATIPNTYPQALDFMFAHPDYGVEFRLLNNEERAREELESLEKVAKAFEKARTTPIEELKVIVSVLGGSDQATQSEVMTFAMKQAQSQPERFLGMFNNQLVESKYLVTRASREGHIEEGDDCMRWAGGEVIINTTPGRTPKDEFAKYLISDDPKAARVKDELLKVLGE